MTRHTKRTFVRHDVLRTVITALAILAAVYLLLSNTADRRPVASSEARFIDQTDSGLTVVPASGASEASYVITGSYTGTYTGSYTGTYTGTYTSSYGPNTGSYTGSYVGGSTGSYTPGTGSYTPTESSYSFATCWDGSRPAGGVCPPCPDGFSYDSHTNTCVPPPGTQFTSFTTPYGFTATGHLQLRPSLVRVNDTTRVFWNVNNVRDCTVTGSNGDSWTSNGSGDAGVVTSRIQSKTEYTLFCHTLRGAQPSTITETKAVNVLPTWYEPGQQGVTN